MRVFLVKRFGKWALASGLDDAVLWAVAEETLRGKVEADLGGTLFKKRIARPGQGKSGGFRVILCLRRAPAGQSDGCLFFLHGFAKSAAATITAAEEQALRLLAASLVRLSEDQMQALRSSGALRELERME